MSAHEGKQEVGEGGLEPQAPPDYGLATIPIKWRAMCGLQSHGTPVCCSTLFCGVALALY
uniref:Uncharacterized protein n=1 Tax=Timema cristinae TaxID=61476 RepID=A0A7R9DFI2_TIMCR|nr:unnamed protein product [Timema cristinae]